MNIDAIAKEPAVDESNCTHRLYEQSTFVKITDALIAGK